MDPLDRKLAEINGRIETLGRQYRSLDALFERVARLERQHIQDDAAIAAGKRLLGDMLVLAGRRLRGEDGRHN